MKSIKSTLQKTNIDPYKEYNDQDIDLIVSELEKLLTNDKELEKIRDNDTYRHNILTLVRFTYTKVLSQTKEKLPPSQHTKKPALLSSKSLDNLYSFAV